MRPRPSASLRGPYLRGLVRGRRWPGGVRAAARRFGVSKSTVHKDLSQRLPVFNRPLYLQAKAVLDRNKAERHIRGGNATREKYRLSTGQARRA